MKTLQYKNITWIDVENPKAQDILFLKEKFNFHPLVLEELTSPSQRPRAEEFDNCLYIVTHLPLYDKKTKTTHSGELDIIITRDHIITSHPNENIPLKSVIKKLADDESLKVKYMSGSVGFFLYFLLENLISACFPKIDHISEKIESVENNIFSGKEKEMVRDLSNVKRDVLAFRRILKPQRSILESLVKKRYRLLEENLNDYFQDLIGTNIRVWNAVENTKEVIESLEETNNSLLSYKINEAMRFLTAISLITFTLSVITGVFGMTPFNGFFLAHQKETFWLIIMLMAAIALSLFLFFKRKRWL